MNVDPKVFDLAFTFLEEVKRSTDRERWELARRIQRTIEDFIAELEEAEFQRSQQAVNELPGA